MNTPALRLPDVIAVGPQRTGTTWLHHVLAGHVGLPAVKETDFFWKNYSKGLDWYVAYFEKCRLDRPIVEVDPNYFGFPEACERISYHIPHCKIICSVRDPVERAYSHYRLLYRDGWTRSTFAESVIAIQIIHEPSRYAFHLKNWLARFGKDRVAVCIYDDLDENPQSYLNRICEFIKIPRIDVHSTAVGDKRINVAKHRPPNQWIAQNARKARVWMQLHNWHRMIRRLERIGFWSYCFEGGRDFGPMDAATERRLREYFSPEVEALEELIQRDLSSWKRPR